MEARGARSAESIDFTRIVAFTDGVFAIAITLLVLNFDVPDLPEAREYGLGEYLGQLWGDVGAYFLTFAVVGRLWLVHHRLFSSLDSFDARLLVLNLAYLSMIALAPFPAELLGDYGDQPVPVAIYAAVLGAAAALNWVMARHSIRAGHIHPDRRAAAEPWGRKRALHIPGVFLVAIPVAFLSPLAAEVILIGLLLSRFVVDRRKRNG